MGLYPYWRDLLKGVLVKGGPFFALFVFECLISDCVGQSTTTEDSEAPRLPINPQSVRLTMSGQTTDSPLGNSGSTQDAWQSLANPPSPLEVTNTPPVSTPNNRPLQPNPVQGGNPAMRIPKKDEYGPQTGWGIRGSGGLAIQQRLTAAISQGNGHLFYDFQPGARFDLETFYNVTNGFYFGLEGGFIYNQISSILYTENGETPFTTSPGDPYLKNAAFYQIPVLLNIRFQIPNTGRFRGYCTGGFGGVWDSLNFSLASGNTNKNQWNYAFQLGAGFQYNLLPGLDLDTSFKTFITPNPLLFSDGTSQVKSSYNYALEIGLAYRF